MAADQVHFVRVDRRRRLRSETLPARTLQHLESEFHASHWILDRWTRPRFRDAAIRTLSSDASGGLVLVGPTIRFNVPPPFTELFEPLPLTGGVGGRSAQLDVLTGPEPSRQEKRRRRYYQFVGVVGGIIAIGWLLSPLVGPYPSLMLVLAMNVTLHVLIVLLSAWWRRRRGRWYLLPAAVAIVGGIGSGPGGLIRLTRFDTVAIVRETETVEGTVPAVELITSTGERYRYVVTEREALAFLAAWQSPRPPPSLEELRELPGVSRAALPGN